MRCSILSVLSFESLSWETTKIAYGLIQSSMHQFFWSDTMHLILSMALHHHCSLKQGDCKNAFCQGTLPPDEITIVKPPIGDPEATKDEYWLLNPTMYRPCHSPWHWYTKIKPILNQLGLHQNAYNPCLFTGYVIDP
jgi:hypothetical protein